MQIQPEQNSALEIILGGYDPDGDSLTFSLTQSPLNGQTTLNGNSVFYTPAEGFAGVDNLSFIVSDGELTSSAATISIFVNAINAPPIASDPVSYTHLTLPTICSV